MLSECRALFLVLYMYHFIHVLNKPRTRAAPSPLTEGQRQLEVSSPACSRLGLQLRQASLGSILLSHCPVGVFSSRLAS